MTVCTGSETGILELREPGEVTNKGTCQDYPGNTFFSSLKSVTPERKHLGSILENGSPECILCLSGLVYRSTLHLNDIIQ